MTLILRRPLGATCFYLTRCFSSRIVQLETEQETSFKDSTIPDRSHNPMKSLNIAIIGAPNAGKSTLINQLVDRCVCPASSKVHTTRQKARAVYTKDNVQLVFIDTPGVVEKSVSNKFKLEDSFHEDLISSLDETDVVGIIQDASNIFTRSYVHPKIVEAIQHMKNDIPLLLILNKVDKLRNKKLLLELTKSLLSKYDIKKFENVFMISALLDDGVDDLKNYFVRTAKEKNWQYLEDTYTDQSAFQLIENTVKSKLLDGLPNEIPYNLDVHVDNLKHLPDDSIICFVTIKCQNIRILKLLLKHKGSKIKSFAAQAEETLRHAFRTYVKIVISVTAPGKV